MSRKIKFRHVKPDGSVEFEQLNREMSGGHIEQYTGLKDKNGKEIYEGDIVKGEMGVFEVRWYDAIASFCFKPNMGMEWHPNCNQGTTDYMEVIGNIHENSELLGGEE